MGYDFASDDRDQTDRKDRRIEELEARIKEIEARIATAGALVSQNASPETIMDALCGRLKRQS